MLWLLVLLLSAPPADAKPAPYPRAILKLDLEPWTPEAYDASYRSMLKAAEKAGAEKPHAVALERTAEARMQHYPRRFSPRQKQLLYQLEVKWIEDEKERRDRLEAQRVLEALVGCS